MRNGEHRSPGYSLYELLITVAVMAIVLTVGIPSFSDVLARQRQRVELNALFHAIHLAKKESVVRNRVVSICASKDLRQCESTSDWSSGWLVFENTDKDQPARIDDGEALIARHSVEPNIEIRSNRRSYTFRSTQKRATNGTLVVCDETGRIEPRALVLSYTGRPRITSENRYGTPYTCSD